jgi:hypothetical protein
VCHGEPGLARWRIVAPIDVRHDALGR